MRFEILSEIGARNAIEEVRILAKATGEALFESVLAEIASQKPAETPSSGF